MMLKKLLSTLFISTGLLFFISCSEKADPGSETEKFTRIYDHNDFNASFTPVDIQQTTDGGYLILGERRLKDTRLTGIYLLKADKFGNFTKSIEVGDTLVNPVGKLTFTGNRFYFFCMQSTASTGSPAQTQLASIDENLFDLSTTAVATNTYPAISAFTGNSFILLSYNNDNKESVISEISLTGTVTKSKGYTVGVGEGSEDAIVKHYNKEGKQFPFQVGMVSPGLYYFNGFYDYTFSLVFTDLSDNAQPKGLVQGQQQNGGFSAITTLSAGKFSAARFNFGDNYFLLNPTINTVGNSSSTDINGYSLPELINNTKVKILQASIDTKPYLVYGADTQTRQIGLYFYDETTGTFLSSRYLGFSNPFEIASVIQTADEGLAICGTTYLAGRFPRICLFKLSKDEVNGNINR